MFQFSSISKSHSSPLVYVLGYDKDSYLILNSYYKGHNIWIYNLEEDIKHIDDGEDVARYSKLNIIYNTCLKNKLLSPT